MIKLPTSNVLRDLPRWTLTDAPFQIRYLVGASMTQSSQAPGMLSRQITTVGATVSCF